MSQRIDNLYPDSRVLLGVGNSRSADYEEREATFFRIEGEGDARLASFGWEDEDGVYRWAAHRAKGRWVLGKEQTPITLEGVISDPRFPDFNPNTTEAKGNFRTEWGTQFGGEDFASNWNTDKETVTDIISYFRKRGRYVRLVWRQVTISRTFIEE